MASRMQSADQGAGVQPSAHGLGTGNVPFHTSRPVTGLLLALLLSASPLGVETARAHVAAKAWEELYLSYSAADPAAFSAKDKKEIGAALLKGAVALQKTDPVMAFSLAERAAAFDESPQSLLALATTARKAEQPASAEEALRKGAAKYPDDPQFAFELGKLQVDELDYAGALVSLSKVTKKSPNHAQAQALISTAKKQLQEEKAARAEALALERRINAAGNGGDVKSAVGVDGVGDTQVTGLSYESSAGPGGMRQRVNARFRMRYFGNDRDFGQRADYEGRVSAALEESYAFSRKVLGVTRKQPLDVILYTREEFAIHNGAAAASQIAGLYSMGAIRMNDSAELTPSTRATLVHEYTHAVIDDHANNNAHAMPTWINEGIAEYVEWRYQGGDGPPPGVAKALRGAAGAGQLPTLQQMSGGMLIQLPNPGLAYAYSAVAVRLMLKNGGADNFMGLVKDVGGGTPFDEAFVTRYGRDVAALDRDARSEVSR